MSKQARTNDHFTFFELVLCITRQDRRTPMVNFSHDGFGDRSTRGICLQATTVSTPTNAASCLDNHMTSLTGGPRQACGQKPILNNNRPHPRASQNSQEVIAPPPRTLEVFS